jgi:hypothetical protein
MSRCLRRRLVLVWDTDRESYADHNRECRRHTRCDGTRG